MTYRMSLKFFSHCWNGLWHKLWIIAVSLSQNGCSLVTILQEAIALLWSIAHACEHTWNMYQTEAQETTTLFWSCAHISVNAPVNTFKCVLNQSSRGHNFTLVLCGRPCIHLWTHLNRVLNQSSRGHNFTLVLCTHLWTHLWIHLKCVSN